VKRTERAIEPANTGPDIAALVAAITYLDGALKRGLVIGVYEDSMEVSDEDIVKAASHVRERLIEVAEAMARVVVKLNGHAAPPPSLAH
jgi:hypothetical protein